MDETGFESDGLCRIEESLGHLERCPGSSCPFWETGTTPHTGGCIFAELDLAGRRDLVQWLHDLRQGLEAGTAPGGDEARRLFFERLNSGRSD